MKNRIIPVIGMILTFASISTFKVTAAEANADTKIIIEATDDNTVSEDLQYAINSNDESAFGTNNIFEVKKGESYIVYVKDLAGNITSKIITVDSNGKVTSTENNSSSSGNSGGSKKSKSGSNSGTNIQVKPAASTNASTVMPDTTQNTNDKSVDYTKGTGSTIDNGPSGSGSVIDENITEAALAEKEFYTIQTADGNVFYLIIDRTQNSENVYFLDVVKEKDLLSLAVSETEISEETEPEPENEPLFFQKEEVEPETEMKETVPDNNKKKQNGFGSTFLILIIFGVVLLGGYYIKIYKPKQKCLDDAYDLDEDFEVIEEEMYIPEREEQGEAEDGETEK